MTRNVLTLLALLMLAFMLSLVSGPVLRERGRIQQHCRVDLYVTYFDRLCQ